MISINSQRSVLFIGTFPPPITGQSASFELLYRHYSGKKFRVDKTARGNSIVSKIIPHVACFFKTFFFLSFKRVDVIYMTTFSSLGGSISDVLILGLNLLFRKRVIVHLQASNFKSAIASAPYFFGEIVNYLYRRVDTGIVLCDEMKEQLRPLLSEEKIHIVHNYYDNGLDIVDAEFRKDKFKVGGILRIGYLSNLIYSKGVFDVIDAFEKLQKSGISVELHIAGKPMKDEYHSEREVEVLFKQRLNSLNNITYYGVISGTEKVEFLKGIDIFVLPSFYVNEAQPLSIIEAMRAGCVLIATNYKYLPGLVLSQNGYIVPVQSPDNIAEVIKKVGENEEQSLAMQFYNIQTAKIKYSQEVHLSSVYSIIG